MVHVSEPRTGAGDPTATLALLWRAADNTPVSSRRGPRRTLSIDAVVDAATALADRDGLPALTMRSLAQVLAIAPMTIYTYVPGRAELLDLMLDAAYAQMTRTPTEGQPWQARVRAVADDNRALFTTHPWAAAISTLRPPLGPGQMAKYEHELAALDGLGLTDVQIDDALNYLLTFVRANAQDAIAARTAQHNSAMNDQAWWDRAGPLLARVLNETTYPLATRIGTAAGAAHGSAHNPDHAYNFGIDRILDALTTLNTNAPGSST
jgi:AcrR family transcriptional regulator